MSSLGSVSVSRLAYIHTYPIPSIGSRVFTPKPLSYSFNLIGGVSVLLGLVAMASDVDGLYASLKVLVCIVKSSRKMQLQMDTVRGYQVGTISIIVLLFSVYLPITQCLSPKYTI